MLFLRINKQMLIFKKIGSVILSKSGIAADPIHY